MSAPVRQRGFLLTLAAEGIAPLIDGTAASAVGLGQDHAVNRFGPTIVEHWTGWMRNQPLALRLAALSELADLPSSRARADALSAVDRLAVAASSADRSLAVEYLSALPRACQPSLVLDPGSGGWVLPARLPPDDPGVLVGLLPIDVPPYPPGTLLPGTAYQLGDVLSTLSGVLHRATRDGQYVTVRFPVKQTLVARLREQRSLLEQLCQTGQNAWSERLVRLLDFDLDHATPFLVHESFLGGDLAILMTNLRDQAHRGLTPDEILKLIEQLAEGLAFAHERGLVHGDLKPANVLVSGDAIKLANLGIGPTLAAQAGARDRPAEQIRLRRGAASWPYLPPECRQGEPPTPQGDLYSLGVLWYQLLAGDLTGALPPDWADEISDRKDVPATQSALLLRCLGGSQDRLPNAGALLTALRPGSRQILTGEERDASIVTPEEVQRERRRKQGLLKGMKLLRVDLDEWENDRKQARRITRVDLWLALVPALAVFAGAYFPTQQLIAANLLGVVAGVVLVWLRLRGRKASLVTAQLALSRQVDDLAEQHPDEVQSWGGTQALLNPELLPECIGALDADMRALAIREMQEL